MSTTVQSNQTVDLGERCHALEQECAELRERVERLENPPTPPRRRVRAIVADGLFVLLGGLVVAAIAGGVAIAAGVWKLDSDASEDAIQAPPATVAQGSSEDGPFAGGSVATQAAPATSASGGQATDGAVATGAPVHLVASAVGGDCWLQVRRGNADGEVLWEGILADGTSEEFDGERFWIRMGNPTNLRLDVNGERVGALPSLAADMLITESGASVVPTS